MSGDSRWPLRRECGRQPRWRASAALVIAEEENIPLDRPPKVPPNSFQCCLCVELLKFRPLISIEEIVAPDIQRVAVILVGSDFG
jgi:hypothetical protein